jgi:hypothetical protein
MSHEEAHDHGGAQGEGAKTEAALHPGRIDFSMEQLLTTLAGVKAASAQKPDEDVIVVSDTVSAAASAYETIRNTLEYDEDHLLRRNAIRRIAKRRIEEEDAKQLASDLLRELIWAHYLPNKKVPERMIDVVAGIIEKYRPLFLALRELERDRERTFEWLTDLLSTEIEYILVPPRADEALASLAYQELKERMVWSSPLIAEADRDLQLYIAVHRMILKSNSATLRFRVFTLYYPQWTKVKHTDALVVDVSAHLTTIIQSIERQLKHPGADPMARLVRRHTILFHLLRDVAEDNPDAFRAAVEAGDTVTLDTALTKAVKARYKRFHNRLRRSVVRAVLFLLLTKTLLAVLIELPYEQIVLQTTNKFPLFVNILFHPLLLGFLGLTVRVPEKKNTEQILQKIHGILNMGRDFTVTFKTRRPWASGAAGAIFKFLYVIMFLVTVGAITWILRGLEFHTVSILFFLFFLSLVMFFGYKIRSGKKDLLVSEQTGGFLGFLSDLLFLPVIRAGRWLAMRAPRINIFLFFFDFIVEAPFKGMIRLIESWIAFLREKKEEI